MVSEAHPPTASVEISEVDPGVSVEDGEDPIAVGDVRPGLGLDDEVEERAAVCHQDCVPDGVFLRLEKAQGFSQRAGLGGDGIGAAPKKATIGPGGAVAGLADDGPAAEAGLAAPGCIESKEERRPWEALLEGRQEGAVCLQGLSPFFGRWGRRRGVSRGDKQERSACPDGE